MRIQTAMERKKTKIRTHIALRGGIRLSVNRSLRHISAQVFNKSGDKVLAAASSQEKDIRAKNLGNNIELAKLIGGLIAQRALQTGLKVVAFDRSGYKFHGRVKALADAARASGLEF